MDDYILEVQNLTKVFPVYGGVFWKRTGTVHAVEDISFHIRKGQTLGLVGESGCGKTTAGRTILHLYPPDAGEVLFAGMNLTRLGKKALRMARREMQMIFQDPYESLDARQTVGEILKEPFAIHGIGTNAYRMEKVHELLERVNLQKDAKDRFPHEFSGGQRQRIGIARAISLNPKLIICDEPVSALDVSIQSQILNLLMELQKELGLTYLFIAHDLSVVRHISDYVAVMYLGKIVEYTDARSIYETPLHPYTKALISSIPEPDPGTVSKREVLKGDIPSPLTPPSGCRFHTRCPIAADICKTEVPKLRLLVANELDGHHVACHRV